jgi:hypothetical protein
MKLSIAEIQTLATLSYGLEQGGVELEEVTVDGYVYTMVFPATPGLGIPRWPKERWLMAPNGKAWRTEFRDGFGLVRLEQVAP